MTSGARDKGKMGARFKIPGTTTATLPPTPKQTDAPMLTTARGPSTKNPTSTPNLGPRGRQAQRQGRPGAADWASQPSSAPADACSVLRRPNPGLSSHFSRPPGRPKGVVTTRGQKRPRRVEGRGERTGPAGSSQRTGSETGSTGPEGQAQVPAASGRSKPQWCGHSAGNSRRHHPFNLGERLLTMLGLNETAGRRLTRAGRRQQTQRGKKVKNKATPAARRGVGLYRAAQAPRTPGPVASQPARLAAEFA